MERAHARGWARVSQIIAGLEEKLQVAEKQTKGEAS